jgi:hypothetical protein
VIVSNSHGVTLASYGFFDPRTEKDRRLDLTEWELKCPQWTVRMQKNLLARPKMQPLKIEVLKGGIIKLSAPGQDCTYFAAQNN